MSYIYNVPLSDENCKLKYSFVGGLVNEGDSSTAILVTEDSNAPPASPDTTSSATSSSSSTTSATTSSYSYGPSSTVDAPCPTATNGTTYTDQGTLAGTYNIYCGQNIQYSDIETPPNINSFDACMQACDSYMQPSTGGVGP